MNPANENAPKAATFEASEPSNQPTQDTASAAKRKRLTRVDSLDPILERVNRSFCWQKFGDGYRRIEEQLTAHHVKRHLKGLALFGVCPMAPGESTTRLALLDLDSHKGETPWDEMLAKGINVADAAFFGHGLHAIPFRSSGGHGIHLFFIWEDPQEAYSTRELLRRVLRSCDLEDGTGGVKAGQCEIFPKQDRIPESGFGNQFALPFGGRSKSKRLTREDGWPRALPGDWPMSDPVQTFEKPEREKATVSEHTTDLAELQQLLGTIPNTGEQSLSYDDWWRVVAAIHHATDGGDEGLALAEEFSTKSPKADLDFLQQRVWPYLGNDRDSTITVATLRHLARQHEDPAADFEALPEETGTAARPRFASIPLAELLQSSRLQWLIKQVLPRYGLGVIYGETGSGKTFSVLDLVLSIARGVSWRGLRTRPGRVSYVCAEGAAGLGNRIEAYRRQHGEDIGTFRAITDVPNLLRQDDVALAAQINHEGGADIIVIDTLAQVTPGGDENSSESMGLALAHCRRLAATTGAFVLLVHHAGKDLSRGARGWSGLKAAADAELAVERNPTTDDRTLTISKLKDGTDGATFHFKLQPVVLGQDEDGDAITSCVVEYTEGASKVRTPRGKWALAAWKAIHDLCTVGEDSAPISAVIDHVVADMIHDPKQGRDTRRQQAKRGIEELVDKGFIGLADDRARVL